MKSIEIALALTFLAFAPGLVLAQQPPGSGIYGTKHDFTAYSGQHQPISGVEVGLCSICHTPHSALTTKLLWNQRLTTAHFNWGDTTTTIGGTVLPNSAHLGPSTKCLSCHDGTVAVGDVVMYKGKTNGTDTLIMRMARGGNSVGYRGDMSGVHPIGIPYPLENKVATYNGVTTGNETILAEFKANPHSPRNKAVKLYNDDGGGVISPGAISGASGVECSTCHDPHNKEAQDEFFLRGKLGGSSATDGYICTQCHVK
jgi:hypothetical protein